MKRTVYGYSQEEEAEEYWGSCETREEALALAPSELALSYGDAFYVVRGEFPDAGLLVPDMQAILDHMREALDGVASVPGQELIAADGAGLALDAALQNWARQHVTVAKWVAVGPPEKHLFSPAPSDANGAAVETPKESA